jgi:predicted dinucleotide-binding enzyme
VRGEGYSWAGAPAVISRYETQFTSAESATIGRALALAGSDASAKQLIAKLYDEFGFDALDIGDLQESRRIAPGQPAFVTPQRLVELKANVAAATRT